MSIASPVPFLAAALLIGLSVSPLDAACGGGGGGCGGGGGAAGMGGARVIGGGGCGNQIDPEGKAFRVSIASACDETCEARKDRIVFGDKTLVFATLAEGKVAYTWHQVDKAAVVTASVGDAKSGGIAFQGKISANVLTGTLTISAKDGTTKTYQVASIADVKAKS